MIFVKLDTYDQCNGELYKEGTIIINLANIESIKLLEDSNEFCLIRFISGDISIVKTNDDLRGKVKRYMK